MPRRTRPLPMRCRRQHQGTASGADSARHTLYSIERVTTGSREIPSPQRLGEVLDGGMGNDDPSTARWRRIP